jgi:NAD(P)-dependent dehydrogenase (short-subunit alcohol dehydrogenase family)
LGRPEGSKRCGCVNPRKLGSQSKARLRYRATINDAIIALAKAFAEQGIKDGVQVNSVVPGAVMTGRRRSSMD